MTPQEEFALLREVDKTLAIEIRVALDTGMNTNYAVKLGGIVSGWIACRNRLREMLGELPEGE